MNRLKSTWPAITLLVFSIGLPACSAGDDESVANAGGSSGAAGSVEQGETGHDAGGSTPGSDGATPDASSSIDAMSSIDALSVTADARNIDAPSGTVDASSSKPDAAVVDAAPKPACPATPPSNGSACAGPADPCFYENCSAGGRALAQCTDGSWAVETGPCGAVTCTSYPHTSMKCQPGQMCQVTAGGALLANCVSLACQGLVTCACTKSCGCVQQVTVADGVTVTCNSCPQGNCP